MDVPNRPRGLRALLVIGLCALGVASAAARADWHLDADASTLGFASVKNGSIAEGHRFHSLSGRVDEHGAELVIDLASVDTQIEIRDERMREMLFEVVDFPQAVFRAELDASMVDGMASGDSQTLDIAGTLSIHGVEAPVSATVVVTRAAEGRVVVASARPVVVSASALDLGDGIQRLQEVAGLAGITTMVPVTFTLTFESAPDAM